MIAILTVVFVADVDDEQEAIDLALEMDRGAILNVEHVLEQWDLERAELETKLRVLPTQINFVPHAGLEPADR